VCIQALSPSRARWPVTRERACLSLKSARPLLIPCAVSVPGEQAKTCRHEFDCSLSGAGSRKTCPSSEQAVRCLRPRRGGNCGIAGRAGRMRFCAGVFLRASTCRYRLRTRTPNFQSRRRDQRRKGPSRRTESIRDREFILSTVSSRQRPWLRTCPSPALTRIFEGSSTCAWKSNGGSPTQNRKVYRRRRAREERFLSPLFGACFAGSWNEKKGSQIDFTLLSLADDSGADIASALGRPTVHYCADYGTHAPFPYSRPRVRLFSSSTWGRADQQTSHDSNRVWGVLFCEGDR
jgi:hypothetical protein